jgi:hypothetical protein
VQKLSKWLDFTAILCFDWIVIDFQLLSVLSGFNIINKLFYNLVMWKPITHEPATINNHSAKAKWIVGNSIHGAWGE